jgi:hypothetical protein
VRWRAHTTHYVLYTFGDNAFAHVRVAGVGCEVQAAAAFGLLAALKDGGGAVLALRLKRQLLSQQLQRVPLAICSS